jgi:hypothetical protein
MGKALNGSFDVGLLEFRFEVQNVFFLDCPTMIALEFCIRSNSCFKFGLFMLERSKNVC